jgi:hypothetical protein
LGFRVDPLFLLFFVVGGYPLSNVGKKTKKRVLTAVVRGPKNVRTQVKKHVPMVKKRVQEFQNQLKRRSEQGRKVVRKAPKSIIKTILSKGKQLR